MDAALTHDSDDGGRKYILTLPEDSVDTWKVLLYLTTSRSLPQMFYAGEFDHPDLLAFAELLVHCWVLGDKYCILQFQDLIMAELLEVLAGRIVAPNAVVAAALHADPSSKLYELMVQAMAVRLAIYYGSQDVSSLALDLERYDIRDDFVERVGKVDVTTLAWGKGLYQDQEEWMRFMVDGGPGKQWLNVFVPFTVCHDEDDCEHVDNAVDGEGAPDAQGADKEPNEQV